MQKIGVFLQGDTESDVEALKLVLKHVIRPSDGPCIYLLLVQAPPKAGSCQTQETDGYTQRWEKEKIERITDQCKSLCLESQVRVDVKYSNDADSVQSGLVDHIKRLRLQKLILGTSTTSSALYRESIISGNPSAFCFEESIARSVAKLAPDYCSVVAVIKGNLTTLKEAKPLTPKSISTPKVHNKNNSINIQQAEICNKTREIINNGSSNNNVANIQQSEISRNNSEKASNNDDKDIKTAEGINTSKMVISFNQSLNEVAVRYEAAMMALETALAENKLLKAQLDSALQHSEKETMRCAELTKLLEKEMQQRVKAEERASREIISRQKAYQKYCYYSFTELQSATNNFSENCKIGEGGYGSVYKGRLHYTDVAVKLLAEGLQGRHEFEREVEILSKTHHPHVVMLLGACPEKACIVYEYMSNGSLDDHLNLKSGTPPLPWYIRFRICHEIATGLLFLHSHVDPIIHRDFNPRNILLDHNYVSKVSDIGKAKLVPCGPEGPKQSMHTMPVGTFAYIDPECMSIGTVSCSSDVYALGITMLQILTGRPAVGVTHIVEAAVDQGDLGDILDKSAGDWPLLEAMELACLSLQCAEPKSRHRPCLEAEVLPVLERIRKCADEAAVEACFTFMKSKSLHTSGQSSIPIVFFCPISQEIMKNPCIAADGFTYEHDTIKAWLEKHDTSPMTNLTLHHKNLIPNYSLRSAISEWHTEKDRTLH